MDKQNVSRLSSKLFIGESQIHPPVIAAPMAGYSDIPTRVLNHRFGAGMSVTEMVSAKALVSNDPNTMERLTIHPEEKKVGIQIFGSDPGILGEAVQKISDRLTPTCVDLNMGCPVKKISRGGHGAALMADPDKVYRILRAMVQASPLSITVKIRSGPQRDTVNFLEVGLAAQEAGVLAVTIHPRTRTQGFDGLADWTEIALLKQHLRIPVIGNGDILSLADGLSMMRQTGCDGIMVGRGAVGNPWLFRQFEDHFDLQNGFTKPLVADRWKVAREHFSLESMYSRNPERAYLRVRKSLTEYFSDLSDYDEIVASIRKATSNDELALSLEQLELNSLRITRDPQGELYSRNS